MLKSLGLEGVGPAAVLSVAFSPRLSVITGDNGLGKRFLTGIACWALTRTWARGMPALPSPGSKIRRLTYA